MEEYVVEFGGKIFVDRQTPTPLPPSKVTVGANSEGVFHFAATKDGGFVIESRDRSFRLGHADALRLLGLLRDMVGT